MKIADAGWVSFGSTVRGAGSFAVVIGVLAGASGCGASMFDRSNGYDAQACVENSLRRNPNPEAAEQVVAELELGCRAHDAGACSALGVVKEMGVAGPKSFTAARNLYSRACKDGNQRGCVNLGRLALDPSNGADMASARSLFTAACDAGEPSGCGELARMMAKDPSASPELVSSTLSKGCSGGDALSCFELAERDRSGQSVALYVQACVEGHEPSCMRIGGNKPRVARR
ncbi:MAG: sel1 repeat family protein [Polyangiaceae bacterium]|nr:sel1 repeat family protein [Polyangiaceae bacterium]